MPARYSSMSNARDEVDAMHFSFIAVVDKALASRDALGTPSRGTGWDPAADMQNEADPVPAPPLQAPHSAA